MEIDVTEIMIRVPRELQPPHIFNSLVHDMGFEPGIWDAIFDEWSLSRYEDEPPYSVTMAYINPVPPPPIDKSVEVRENGQVTILPLDIIPFQSAAPHDGLEMVEPQAPRFTPAMMPPRRKTP